MSLLFFRRLLVVVLLGLAAVTVAVYLRGREAAAVRERARKPVLPVKLSVRQSADRFEVSGSSGGRKLFQLSAAKAEQLRVGDLWQLRAVRIRVFGEDGETVEDEIRGDAFTYDQDKAQATAAGAVEIDLEGRPAVADLAPGASANVAPPHPVHLVAGDLTFDTKSGAAEVTQGLTFTYESARGAAQRAHLERNQATLSGNVHATWTLPPPGAGGAGAGGGDVHLDADRADLDRDAGEVTLSGHASVQNAGRQLAADRLRFLFDANYALLAADAEGNVRAADAGSGQQAAAGTGHAVFAAAEGGNGRELRTLDLGGGVRLAQKTAKQDATLEARDTALRFLPGNQIQTMHANAATVSLEAPPAGRRRMAAPVMDFAWGAPPKAGAQPPLETVSTQGRTLVDLSGESGANASLGGSGPVHMESDQLQLALDAAQQPQTLAASGQVTVAQSGPLGSRTGRGDTLHLRFAPGATGGAAAIATLTLEGEVEMHDPQPAGDSWTRADALAYDGASGRTLFTTQPGSAWSGGHVTGGDPQTRFRALRVSVEQPPSPANAPPAVSRLIADGGVELSFANDPANPMPGRPPGNLDAIADHAVLVSAPTAGPNPNPRTAGGTAELSGHVRLWQSPDLLIADHVALDRARQTLDADGNVETDFVSSQAGPLPTPALTDASASKPGGNASVHSSAPSSPRASQGVQVRAARFRYSGTSGEAVYTGGVVLTTAPDTRLEANRVEATTAPVAGGAGRGGRSNASTGLPGGIAHVVASGEVHLKRLDQTGTAAELNYDASTQVAVLTGGGPRICDAEHGCVSGDPLTYSLQDGAMKIGGTVGSPASGQLQIH